MADNFVENVGRASAQLALNRLKRRKKNVSPATNVYNSVTVNDIQIVLGMKMNTILIDKNNCRKIF